MAKNFHLIRCPYCFSEFAHDKVCFKAKTIFTLQDLEGLGDGAVWGMDSNTGRQVNRQVMEKFIEREDTEYTRFWSEFPDSEPEWEFKDYPVITPESREMTKDGEGYQEDASGFTASVTDCFGKESRIRICPKCHNELPVGYGKYPVCTISIVGITSCGKTVYLSHLMQNFGKVMSWAGLSVQKMGSNVDDFIQENKVAKGKFLPLGTPPDHLTKPLFYKVKNNDRTYVLVFYDIAGENCVKAEKMERYGKFIRKADGILFFLDPEQFIQLREKPEEEITEAKAVLDAMGQAFLDADYADGYSDVPMAVVFSKSDLLKNRTRNIPADSNVYRRIGYGKKGFQMEEYRNINGELRNFLLHLSEGGEIMESLKSNFHRHSFFAVSILDGGVETVEIVNPQGKKINRYKPMNSPSAIRMEEPLFWILWQKGMIEEIENEQKSKKRGWIGRILEILGLCKE